MTKQWNDYRGIITGLYKQENKPLHEVQRIMEEQYNFKASIRAYRSRFDKWKVYKYSCRKRRDSMGDHSEKTSSNSEDCHSPSSFSLGSPVMTSVNRSPPTMCVESTSPEILGSPITKFESRQYERITAPLHPVASLPSPAGLAHDNNPFRFQHHFDQQYYLSGSHLSNEAGGPEGYYHRVSAAHERDHENLYNPAADQSPISSPSEHIIGLSLDGGGGGGSPATQHEFSPQHLHSPNTIGYNSYPISFLKGPRE